MKNFIKIVRKIKILFYLFILQKTSKETFCCEINEIGCQAY